MAYACPLLILLQTNILKYMFEYFYFYSRLENIQ